MTAVIRNAGLTLLALVLLTPFGNDIMAAEPDAAEQCRRLGRGINMGNALEAPSEGAWGMTVEESYLKAIKDAGFDSIRLPVKWSARASNVAPYAIHPQFFERVDEILNQCEALKLNVVLNVHHYDELNVEPDQHGARLVALWEQIAMRYANRPASLYFELNNEPHDDLDDVKWNALIPQVLAAVREKNPTRAVIVGPHGYNGIWALPKLKLPQDDHLIVTVHNYEPFEFTHQGATWATEEVKTIRDREWNGTPEELADLRKRLDDAAAWSQEHKLPIYLGEFGAYDHAPLASRARWTATMAREAEARGFSWAYWEFGSGFGAYDREKNEWREPLLKALMPK